MQTLDQLKTMSSDDEFDCELPDLEEDYVEAHKSHNSAIPGKRTDFYSDSSDIEIVSATTDTLILQTNDKFTKDLTSLGGKGSFSDSLVSVSHKTSTASTDQGHTVVPHIQRSYSSSSIKSSKESVLNEEQDRDGIAFAQDSAAKLVSNLGKAGVKQSKLQEKEQKKLDREKQKQLKEQTKKQAEFEKSKKRILQETIKNSRPGECLKYLTVVVDTCLVTSSCGPAVVKCLQSADVRYEVEKQPEEYMISFWREVTVAMETEPNKLEAKKKEVIDEEVLLYVPLNQFIQMIDGFQKERRGDKPCGSCTLDSFVESSKHALENRTITLLVQGLENYFRQSNLTDKRSFKNRVMEVSGDAPKRKRKAAAAESTPDVVVTRVMVEEAALSLQLRSGTCIKFLESDEEVAKTVMQYAKSVAERPFKRDLSMRLNSGYSGIFVEGCRSGTRVGSDGQGLSRIWCQQLQQFKNVSAEVANAIAARYPSPRMLIEAYQACGSVKEAETLLEDIVVRRGAGIVSTSRRVGKELSRRLYVLMTSDDGSCVIK